MNLEEAVKMFYQVQSREKTLEEMKHRKIGESVYELQGSRQNSKLETKKQETMI